MAKQEEKKKKAKSTIARADEEKVVILFDPDGTVEEVHGPMTPLFADIVTNHLGNTDARVVMEGYYLQQGPLIRPFVDKDKQ